MQYDKKPSCYPQWQRYNTCLAAPSATGKGHRKIEPKAKHFSHGKKNRSSWPNKTQMSETKYEAISNHAYKRSKKTQITFMDKT